MKNNITQWLESITPEQLNNAITINCTNCPAKEDCDTRPQDIDCDDIFYSWALKPNSDGLKSTLTKFFNYLEKHGFIKDDLVFDTEHQIDTYIEQFNNQNK